MAEFAIAAPRTEEITRVVSVGAAAGVTGAIQGVMVKVAPQLGALEPIFTWGTLLGVPAIGAAGALFTRGMVSDVFLGATAGGLGVIGYTLPELLAPITGRRGLGGQGQLGGGAGAKLLGAGNLAEAARRAQAGARVGIEF